MNKVQKLYFMHSCTKVNRRDFNLTVSKIVTIDRDRLSLPDRKIAYLNFENGSIVWKPLWMSQGYEHPPKTLPEAPPLDPAGAPCLNYWQQLCPCTLHRTPSRDSCLCRLALHAVFLNHFTQQNWVMIWLFFFRYSSLFWNSPIWLLLGYVAEIQSLYIK